MHNCRCPKGFANLDGLCYNILVGSTGKKDMNDYRTHVEINLDAIRRNAEAIKTFTGKRLIAVVKADAYGHGVVSCNKSVTGHRGHVRRCNG